MPSFLQFVVFGGPFLVKNLHCGSPVTKIPKDCAK